MKIKSMAVTSHRSPAQLEGLTTCGKFFYARARSGRISINVANTLEQAVFGVDGHGISGYSEDEGSAKDRVSSDQLIKLTEAYLDLCV